MVINKARISKLPDTVGIYLFKQNNKILYIGKSVNIKARVFSHYQSAKLDSKENLIINSADKIDHIICDSEFKALLLEAKLIKKHRPKYNIIWKDDKSNLYIKIIKLDKYPKVFSVRSENDHKSLYFGPFSSVRIVEFILREIRKVFPYCSQAKISKRPCFYSKIGLCQPCPSQIESETNQHEKVILRRLYLKNIIQIVKLLSGKFELVLNGLRKQLKVYSKTENYEQALIFRNKIIYLENFLNQQLRFDNQTRINISLKRQEELKKLIKLNSLSIDNLNRIECYDISNLSGKEAAGSMVVFISGMITKDQYRRFKIKGDLNSDIEMIEEIISRRFKNKTWPNPDLIIIDGGKLQINKVNQTLRKLKLIIPVIAIEKNPDRIIIGNNKLTMVKIDYNNLGYNFVRYIRDESHRFAKKYHLFLRSRKILI